MLVMVELRLFLGWKKLYILSLRATFLATFLHALICLSVGAVLFMGTAEPSVDSGALGSLEFLGGAINAAHSSCFLLRPLCFFLAGADPLVPLLPP